MADSTSGGMTAIVAIVAIIIILGVGFFLVQNYTGKDAGSSIELELPSGNSQ